MLLTPKEKPKLWTALSCHNPQATYCKTSNTAFYWAKLVQCCSLDQSLLSSALIKTTTNAAEGSVCCWPYSNRGFRGNWKEHYPMDGYYSHVFREVQYLLNLADLHMESCFWMGKHELILKKKQIQLWEIYRANLCMLTLKQVPKCSIELIPLQVRLGLQCKKYFLKHRMRSIPKKE